MKIKPKKIYKPKSLKKLARDNNRLDDKQLNEELAQKMINPYYFTDESLKFGFQINLGSHNLHHTNSKLTILSNHP